MAIAVDGNNVASDEHSVLETTLLSIPNNWWIVLLSRCATAVARLRTNSSFPVIAVAIVIVVTVMVVVTFGFDLTVFSSVKLTLVRIPSVCEETRKKVFVSFFWGETTQTRQEQAGTGERERERERENTRVLLVVVFVVLWVALSACVAFVLSFFG